MRIHRLHLSNVKGVADRALDFPDRGVIVLEGPNEVGKTTLVEALDVLLEEKDSSRKRHVLALRPVGRDVPTSIEAELSSGAYRFRYRKQWFRQPATELHVLAPRVEHLIGVAAHERVLSIIAETTDVPLWRALRLMQAAPLGQVELTGSRALSAALDAAAQAFVADDMLTGDACAGRSDDRFDDRTRGPSGVGERPAPGRHAQDEEVGAGRDSGAVDGLMAAVAAEAARYFTAGRGQPTGEYRAAIEAVEQAGHVEAEAAAAVAAVAEDVARHEELAAEARHAEASLAAARVEAAALAVEWDEISELSRVCSSIGRDAEAAGRELARARERHAERSRLVADLAARTETVARLERDIAELRAAAAPDEEALAEAVAARDTAQTSLDGVTGSLRRREAADRVLRWEAEVQALADRLARAEEAAEERRTVAAELAGLTIDAAAVRRAEQAATALDLARSQSAADSARVSLRALADDVSVVLDGVEVPLSADTDLDRSVDSELEIVLPGHLVVRLHPESAAAARAAATAAAEEALAQALAAAGARDLAEARRRSDRTRLLGDRVARATDRLADILAGHTLEGLRDDLAAARAALAEESAAVRALGRTETDGDAAALRARADAARELLSACTARVEAVRAAVAEATTTRARADSLLGSARRELAAARDRLAELREVDDDAALDQALTVAESATADARHRLQTARSALDGRDAETTRIRLDAAQAAEITATERVTTLRDQRLAIEARLEQSGRQGRYEALESARSALEHARRKLGSVQRRAEAARLLRDTLEEHRTAAKRRYVAPFAAAVRRLGRVVYGPGLDIEVDESLAIQARVLDGERIAYDALSTGAKEQLAILTRLAVATLVDEQQGVPVVIDDALGYSDPRRLRRMTAAFSMVGADAQVILLTCTPGRYDGIAGARVIHLGREPTPDRVAG